MEALRIGLGIMLDMGLHIGSGMGLHGWRMGGEWGTMWLRERGDDGG